MARAPAFLGLPCGGLVAARCGGVADRGGTIGGKNGAASRRVRLRRCQRRDESRPRLERVRGASVSEFWLPSLHFYAPARIRCSCVARIAEKGRFWSRAGAIFAEKGRAEIDRRGAQLGPGGRPTQREPYAGRSREPSKGTRSNSNNKQKTKQGDALK